MSDDGPVRITVIYPVRDFDEFAAVLGAVERTADDGVLARRIYRSIDDPNEVMVEMELASAEHAKRLIRGPSVRDTLDRAGAEIYPPAFIGAEVVTMRYQPAT